MRSDDDPLPEPVALIGGLLSLMTSYVRTGCPRQAVFIGRQLEFLQRYPDHLMPPPLKAVARRLQNDWAGVVRALPQHSPPTGAGNGTVH